MLLRRFSLASFLIGSAILASAATTPTVTIKSPGNGSTAGSSVNYVASASSPACSKGIAAMRIYTAHGVNGTPSTPII